DTLLSEWLRPFRRWLRLLAPIALMLIALLVLVALLLGFVLSWIAAAVVFAFAAAVAGAAGWLRSRISRWLQIADMTTTALTPDVVGAAPPRPAWEPLAPGSRTMPAEPAATGTADAEIAARFRAAAETKQQELRQVSEAPADE